MFYGGLLIVYWCIGICGRTIFLIYFPVFSGNFTKSSQSSVTEFEHSSHFHLLWSVCVFL